MGGGGSAPLQRGVGKLLEGAAGELWGGRERSLCGASVSPSGPSYAKTWTISQMDGEGKRKRVWLNLHFLPKGTKIRLKKLNRKCAFFCARGLPFNFCGYLSSFLCTGSAQFAFILAHWINGISLTFCKKIK